MKCKFYEVTNFISEAYQFSLSQVRVVLHFSWRKYTDREATLPVKEVKSRAKHSGILGSETSFSGRG